MREPYGEGLATHADPESCAGIREDAGEVLTGARAGRVLSCEKLVSFGVPTPSLWPEGNTGHIVNARCGPDPAQSETPCTYGNSSYGTWEIPCSTPRNGDGVRVVNPQGARQR